MAEYWISKKQYWCKYCNIWVRDDAPSRRLHETGLKHQGGKERFLRDLYKGGQRAVREKEMEAAEMARIEASAAAAYAHDTIGKSASGPSKPSITQRIAVATAASSSRLRPPSAPVDKYANYSTASQLGFDDAETQKSAYEIEQELKGRKGEAGSWQEVEIPVVRYDENGVPDTAGGFKGKRKLRDPFGPGGGGDFKEEEEEAENFEFKHGDKKIVHDIYDDEDWDPKRALGGLKVKVKEEKVFVDKKKEEEEAERARERLMEGGLKREEWSGKLDLRPVIKDEKGLKYIPEGGWVKVAEGTEEATPSHSPGVETELPHSQQESVKVELESNLPEPADPSTAIAEEITETKPEVSPTPATSTGLFKKRRPPPVRKVK